MGTLLVISEQEKKLVRVVPSERQMRHQKLEFYGFLHFTINTFTDREWGTAGDPKEYRLIIDCLLNMPLLFWASEVTGNPIYR